MTKARVWAFVKYAAVAAAAYYGGPAGSEALKSLWKTIGG